VPRYRYTTVDTRGKTVTGQIEAAGPEAALEKLAQLGIPEDTITLDEIASPAPPGGRLSAEEAAQVAGHAATLAQAGLPLGEGLRALAEEIPRWPVIAWVYYGCVLGLGVLVAWLFWGWVLGLIAWVLCVWLLWLGALAEELSRRRLQTALRRVADCVDAGQPLDAAAASQGRRVPEHVRCMLAASAASGRFAQVLQQLSTVERNRIALGRRLGLALAYPAILLVSAVFLIVFLSIFTVPQFKRIFDDFGTDLPALTQLIIHVFSPMGGLVILALFVAFWLALVLVAALKWHVVWVQRMAYWIPFVGPCWRFRGLAEFSRMTALLLDLQVPLPRALRAMAGGLREADLRAACRLLAGFVEVGIPFSEALVRFREFPASFRPLVAWGERTQALADAMRGTTEMCEARLRFQSLFIAAAILPVALVVIVFAVGWIIVGLLLPLISLIQRLS
jgi:type IV pilus assembly protein PilC